VSSLALGGASSSESGASNEWSVPMTAETDSEGKNEYLGFGTHAGATDGYDSGIDVPHTPPSPGATFDAYFKIVDPIFKQVDKDYRGPADSIVWTLLVKSTSEDITLTWDASAVPENVSLQMNDIDMKAVANTTLPAGDYTLTITATKEITYTLDITSEGCCPVEVVGLPGGNQTVAANTTETFENIPCCTNVTVTVDDSDACCVFEDWSDAGAKSHVIHIDGNKTVTATCSEILPDIHTPIADIDFGYVALGSSLDKTTTIHNDGCGALTINSVTRVSGDLDFTCVGPSTPFDIGGGGSQDITIRFEPYSPDPKSATFNVTSNDPDEPQAQFNTSGNGSCIIPYIPHTPGDANLNGVVNSGDITVTIKIIFDNLVDLMVTSDGCCNVTVGAPINETVLMGESKTFYNIDKDTVVALTADDSALGCSFQSWSGDVDDPDSATTFVNMNVDKCVTANCNVTMASCSEPCNWHIYEVTRESPGIPDFDPEPIPPEADSNYFAGHCDSSWVQVIRRVCGRRGGALLM